VERAKAEAAGLLTDVRRAVSAEWERLKRTERSRPALEESRRRLREAGARVAPAPVTPLPGDVVLAPGMAVAAEHLGLRGELVAIAGDSATVRAGSLSVRVPVSALRPAAAASAPAPRRRESADVPMRAVAPELMLIGRTTDEVQHLVEKYLDDAFMAGVAHVRLVHGKGTGALRKAVRGLLAGHPLVESFRDGEAGEGGAGATVAALKVS
jgi:DNA mismatch repair protein MutS2